MSPPGSGRIFTTCGGNEAGLTVAEITYSNSNVPEHVVMMILSWSATTSSYGWVVNGGWNIADCVQRSYDLRA